jgi:hypothetical protein
MTVEADACCLRIARRNSRSFSGIENQVSNSAMWCWRPNLNRHPLLATDFSYQLSSSRRHARMDA